MSLLEESTSESQPESDEPHEPCPTPLAWQQVREEFLSRSEPFELNHEGLDVHGRVIGEGQPLFFVPGIGGTSELYCLIVWLLREEFRCVVFDYPAQRSARRSLRRPSDYSRLLRSVIDYFGARQVDLYATSFGSVAAVTTLIDSPTVIRRAIIQGGFARRDLTVAERCVRSLLQFVPISLARIPLARAIRIQNHRGWFPPYDESRWAFFEQNTAAVSVAELAARARVLLSFDTSNELNQIKTPTLLIRSEGDGMVASQCHDVLVGGIPNASTESLHTCGHLPYLTHPHRLAKIIRTFLDD